MEKELEQIYLHGCWLGIGGNTPWRIEGKITNITLLENDPRNFMGADNSLITINFDSGFVLEVKTNDYMVVYKEGASHV